jgi:hypothetical protein
MQNTFTQKLLLTILAGFAAAVLLYLLRHLVNQSLHDAGPGWKDIYITTPKPAR